MTSLDTAIICGTRAATGQAYRSLLYHCGSKTVELYQPLQGRPPNMGWRGALLGYSITFTATPRKTHMASQLEKSPTLLETNSKRL